MEKKNYLLDVKLKETLGSELFTKNYEVELTKDFVENANPKAHNFMNHVKAFVERLKQNSIPTQKQAYKKREIYVVNYGMNTWSEINGNRPSAIYKGSHSTFGEDIIVIPLTSALRQKLTDKYDVFVPKSIDNNLFQNSYARLRQIRSVSLKRVGKCMGEIKDPEVIQKINDGIKKMLATDI